MEASGALARLDADGLETLAASCQALSCEFASTGSGNLEALAHEARDAAREILSFARVLDEMRTSLRVMSSVMNLQRGLPGYGPQAGYGRRRMERTHGDD
jgi:hypothetical protein